MAMFNSYVKLAEGNGINHLPIGAGFLIHSIRQYAKTTTADVDVDHDTV